MSVEDLLLELNQHGVSVDVEDANLKIHFKKGLLDDSLLKQVKENKSEIIKHLSSVSSLTKSMPIPTVEIDESRIFEAFPLSDMQEGFFIADHPYMEFQVRPHYYLEIESNELDIELYEQSWNKTLIKHRRSIVTTTKNGELQLLNNFNPIKIKINNLENIDEHLVPYKLGEIRNRLKVEQLPHDSWPWFSLEVTIWKQFGESKKVIHFNSNNFFWDGFSLRQLFYDTNKLYKNPYLDVSPVELTYRDAVIALQKLERSALGERSKTYWETRIENLPPAPNLAILQRKARRVRTYMVRRTYRIDQKTWEKLQINAASASITPSFMFIAAYCVILSRWSNADHFILANMASRRFNEMHDEMPNLLGNFSSVYPLEVDFRETNNFRERSMRVQNQFLEDSKHFFYGGMKVMQSLNRNKGELGSSPCPFVVGSALSMGKFQKFSFSSLETSQALLDHTFWENDDDTVSLAWDVVEDFFPEKLIDSMWDCYVTFIQSLAEKLENWYCSPIQLDTSLNQSIITKVNSTEQDLPLKTLDSFLNEASIRYSDNVAVVSENTSYTFNQLNLKSELIANILASKNVINKAVPIICQKGPALLWSVYGVLKAGAHYVPIDPGLPLSRIKLLISRANASVVLCQTQAINELLNEIKKDPSSNLDVNFIDVQNIESLNDAITDLPIANLDRLAYIIFTSGSTGQPKGVMINHGPAANTVIDINNKFNVTKEDVIFGVSSFGFDLSVYDIFGSAATGATLVFPDPSLSLNPAHWCDLVIQNKVSVWNSVPALAKLLIEVAESRNQTLPSLRLILMSGDWIPIDLPQKLAHYAPNAKLISLGGATEASIWSIFHEIKDLDPSLVSIPYGIPLANQKWHIRDIHNQPAPIHAPGELFISGKGLAEGYFNDEEKTNKSFFIDKITGERFYRTGDYGRYLPDGNIEFLGRIDFQVKIQGNRIELGEIEYQLLEQGDVSEAIVAAQYFEETHSQQLVAYVVLKEGISDAQGVLSEALSSVLPKYMVPSLWMFLDKLPLTANGKIDRKSLPKAEIEKKSGSNQGFQAPTSDAELKLVKIWSQVLQNDKVGVNQDFFELGGDSFAAVRMLALINNEFNVMLSLGDVLTDRTILKLAHKLQKNNQFYENKLLVLIRKKPEKEPIFWVHPAGGNTLCYQELSSHINATTYGFQAVGINGNVTPLEDIKQMASHYAEELLAEYDSHSIRLGGWSSGGLIAFELAHQLISAGRQVKDVFILDSPSPFTQTNLDETTLIKWFIEDLDIDISYESLEIDCPGDRRDDIGLINQVVEKLNANHSISLDAKILLPIFQVFKGIVRGSSNYTSSKIDSNLILLRAKKGQVSEFVAHPNYDQDSWGWEEYSNKELSTYFIPGTHYSLLKGELAKLCTTYINKHI